MNEVISFSKEIEFNTMLNKINSISLENTLKVEDSSIKGDLIVSGTYLESLASQNELPFSYKLPTDIEIDPKYDLSSVTIEIDDFTYEVIENTLKVNVDILLDKLKIKEEDKKEEPLFLDTSKEEKVEVPVEEIEIKEEKKEKIDSLFSNITDCNETYATYLVYIIREDDNLEDILNKYKVSRDLLEEYNDLSEFKKGMKLIIPNINE